MADVTNLYVVEVYQLWKWQRPTEGWLEEWWPSIQRAVKWEISVSPQGLPEHLVDTYAALAHTAADAHLTPPPLLLPLPLSLTSPPPLPLPTLCTRSSRYDIVGLDAYQWCTFNAVLHLLGMRAAMAMATALNDTATLTAATASYHLGQRAINATLWHPTGGYYRAYYNANNASESAVFADALYAQVIANTLGLGDLLPPSQMLSHLRAEVRHNDSPYGLIVQTGREAQSNTQDNAIWMGGSQDWTTLAISLGVPVSEAYEQARKGMDNWRLRLNDQWNVWGLAGGMGIGIDGLHWCTRSPSPCSHRHYSHPLLLHTSLAPCPLSPPGVLCQSLRLPHGVVAHPVRGQWSAVGRSHRHPIIQPQAAPPLRAARHDPRHAGHPQRHRPAGVDGVQPQRHHGQCARPPVHHRWGERPHPRGADARSDGDVEARPHIE